MSHPWTERIAAWEVDPVLRVPERFRARNDVLDQLETAGLAIDAPGTDIDAVARAGWHRRIERLRDEFDAIDSQLCSAIREDIRRGQGARLKRLAIADHAPDGDDGQAYDPLDGLVGGVLQLEAPVQPAVPPSSDMVFYQPTPARHVFRMIAEAGFGPEDVLLDLGSGLGHVPLLASIVGGCRAIGIEWDPAYVHCARRCAQTLGLARVEFVQGDVRDADLSAGSVFYLYTPFRDAMLRRVLDRLKAEAAGRAIRLVALGPCVAELRRESWLRCALSTQPGGPAWFLPV